MKAEQAAFKVRRNKKQEQEDTPCSTMIFYLFINVLSVTDSTAVTDICR
ncbi:hypothetical protein AB8989_00970 [Yersinia hibernica]|nr:hypothetical protein [Yersinia hibernica]